MTTKIGYFVPEFPGQTHIFFWRELKQLRELGFDPEIVSTRMPPKSIVSHNWSAKAMNETTYLFPPTLFGAVTAIWKIIQCGPFAWGRVMKAIFSAEAPTFKCRLRLLLLMMLGARMAHLAQKRKWDHIHVHSCADAANISMFAKLLSNIPYSMTLHGPVEDYGLNQRQKWQHSKFSIVITQKLLREVESELGDYLPESVPVAPMGVELSTFERKVPYEAWTGSGPFKIFSCGRINPCKGHEYLIRAVAALQKRGIDARLKIAGASDSKDDGYYKSLQQTIVDLNVREHVTLMGAVSEKVIRKELEEAHVFALASLHEPLGIVYVEAMAMELPVVGTDSGGVAELIDDGVTGFLANPKSHEDLVAALETIIENPEFAVEVGQLARHKVKKSFHSRISAETIAKNIRRADGRSGERVARSQEFAAPAAQPTRNCKGTVDPEENFISDGNTDEAMTV